MTRFYRSLLQGLSGVLLSLILIIPVQAAAPVNHLVISQIQTAGSGGIIDEFIELYNPTALPITLTDWTVQYKAAFIGYSGVLVNTFPANAVIPAGGFYLLRPFSLPGASDATYVSPMLDEAAGNLFLVKGTTPITSATESTIIDRVGYGAVADAAEGTPVQAPGFSQSIERLPGQNFNEGNGVDTDNNLVDFMIRTVARPRLASSPAETLQAPVIGSLSPTAESVLNSPTVFIKATVDDGNGSGVIASGLTLLIDKAPVGPVTYDSASKVASATLALGQGTHTAVLKATDRAGMSSSLSWNFTVDSLAPSVSLTINDGSLKTNQLPVTVKVNAQDDPLGMASGVAEMQIAFDGVLDNEPWEPFQTSVTRNLMNKEGNQAVVVRVRDRAGNVSMVASATIVYETLATAAANTAPLNALSTTTLTPTGNKVLITWNPASQAVEYLVRYSDGTAIYGPFKTTKTAITIENLNPNKTYRFEVASVNQVGSVSSFTAVVPPNFVAPVAVPVAATETKTAPAPVVSPSPAPTNRGASRRSTGSTATGTVSTGSTETTSPAAIAATASPTPKVTVSASPTLTPVTTPTPSASVSPAIKGSEDNQPRDWTRVVVALSILIIAAGVATGGWYLYQWWTTRPGDEGKGKGKGGRW